MIPPEIPARRRSWREAPIRAGPLRPASRVVTCLALHAALFSAACRDAPSQESVDEAWKRADQAAARVAEAEQHVRHVDRLRDIDRLRSQAESGELLGQVATLRGVAVGLTLTLLAALVWLAIEIRRRRVAIAILRSITSPDVPARPFDSGGA